MTAGTARAARGTPVAGGAPLRFPRTLLIAGTVLGLEAAAHTAGGGALPPVPVMALLTAFTVLPVMALSRFRLSLAAMGAILAAGQLLLHAAFTALAALPSHCGAGGIAAHGHHHDFAIPDCAVTSTAAAAGPRLPEIAEPAMTAAHALAVIATALVLARGEDALWQLRAWLRPLTGILCPVFMVRVPPSPAGRYDAIPYRAPDTRTATPRGPPALAVRFLQPG